MRAAAPATARFFQTLDSTVVRMNRKIISTRLTTCDAVHDGSAVRLDFLDDAGRPVSVEFPFEQAQSLAMTLPALLSRALRRKMNDDASRFVFGLGRWSLESTDSEWVIMTLGTEDGFEVSFGVPYATCSAMGWALRTAKPAFAAETDHSIDDVN